MYIPCMEYLINYLPQSSTLIEKVGVSLVKQGPVSANCAVYFLANFCNIYLENFFPCIPCKWIEFSSRILTKTNWLILTLLFEKKMALWPQLKFILPDTWRSNVDLVTQSLCCLAYSCNVFCPLGIWKHIWLPFRCKYVLLTIKTLP
jgi:hypothetical protein